MQQFYARIVRLYDSIARSIPGVGRIRRESVGKLHLEAGDTVIDFGCGTGANTPYLRRQVGDDGRVIGVDFTVEAIEWARNRRDHHGWENVQYLVADASTPPIQGRVDGVLSTFVIGMFDNPGEVVETWCDLIDEGALVSTYLAPSQRWYGPVFTPLLEAVTRITTPPVRRFRYEEALVGEMQASQEDARRVLRRCAGEFVSDSYAGGLCFIDAAYW